MLLKRAFPLWALIALTVSLSEVGGATLLESAKKEGTVVFYASVPQDQISRLSEGFEKKYPPIKVQALRAGPSRILSRVMTEERAGNPLVDVINLDTFNAWVLKSKGFLQSYRSDEMEAFPDEFKDPEAMMPCCMYVLTNVMAYNTRSLSQRDIPKAYTDLLDRKWKGKMGLDNDDAKWFAPLVAIWGKERTVNYFRSLMKQEPSMVRGHALQTELLAAGEFSLAVNLFGYQALELQSRGAPIEIIQADPVIARAGHLLLPKRAPHPNAAKLFIDYLLSAEGQQLLAKMGREVARRGIAIKYPRLLQGVKVQTVKSESLVNFEELSQLYNSIVR